MANGRKKLCISVEVSEYFMSCTICIWEKAISHTFNCHLPITHIIINNEICDMTKYILEYREDKSITERRKNNQRLSAFRMALSLKPLAASKL